MLPILSTHLSKNNELQAVIYLFTEKPSIELCKIYEILESYVIEFVHKTIDIYPNLLFLLFL